MTRVRIDLFVSLDGYTSTGQTPENPMGEDWGRLTAAYAATRTFHERVFGDTSGAGTTGIDDAYAASHFEGIGAEIIVTLRHLPNYRPRAGIRQRSRTQVTGVRANLRADAVESRS